MMASPCIVKYCKNIGNHRLPRNEIRREEWIKAIQHINPGLTIRKNSFICSAHFRPVDFAITPTSFTKLDRAPRVLKKTAIPSVFPWTPVSQLKIQPLHEKSSPADTLSFKASMAQKTYYRVPPIMFVELPLTSDSLKQTNLTEDPLQLLDEMQIKIENVEDEPMNDDKIVKIEIDMKSVRTQTQDNGVDVSVDHGTPVKTLSKHKLKVKRTDSPLLSECLPNHSGDL